MDTIGLEDLWTFTDSGKNAEISDCRAVRASKGHEVSDFFELAAKIAELQFRNRSHVLFYRGQHRDWIAESQFHIGSTLRPTIFRRPIHPQNSTWLSPRFERLRQIEPQLVQTFRNNDFLGADEITKYRILRWAIIQHYEICETPLLDVTQSLRIGASFASVGNKTGSAFLFVLGVPNVSGAITASAEAGLQTIRLSSVCPPTAMRPHIQEGFLLGEYPEIGDIDQKQNYSLHEVDFGKRLVAKFRFNPTKFWTNRGQFQEVGRRALYPSEKEDPVRAALNSMSIASQD
ncbi:FRG domain-containing protein [Roseibium sp.]|uniref:FRG domain-containing protein n=1 Tax=Roseibium sp. TaxID=1936156 RepID=UPI003A972437